MGILTAPIRGLLSVFEEVARQADKELFDDDELVRHQLSQLYANLQAGLLDDEEFAWQEAALVQRLERIWARRGTDD